MSPGPAGLSAAGSAPAARGRVAFMVLGCAKNQVEAESMSSRLARMGWELTADVPNASVVVVHTCGFLEAAREEALRTVADLRRAAPRSFLVMTGCFAQYIGGAKARLRGVDALLGTGEFHRLPEVLQRGRGETGEGRRKSLSATPASRLPSPAGYHDAALPRPIQHEQLSAYLRVSEGCNHRCTFCIIPQLRGNLKSRPAPDVYAEARNLLARGVREIVLISQDTTDYGRDLPARPRLTDLIKPMLAWKDLRWLRLLYAYPSEVGADLVSMLAGEEKLCRYLDMPLQHLSDRVLKSMAREWGRKETLALLERLKSRVPDLALRTTFIVGFPGETEEDFRQVLETVEAGFFEHVGVFPYSLEQRSPSFRLEDRVPDDVSGERWKRLLDAQSRVVEKRARERAGREIDVLVERDPRGGWTARGARQAPEVDGQVALSSWPAAAGFHRARLTGMNGIDWTADLLPRRNGEVGMRNQRKKARRSAPASHSALRIPHSALG